MSEELCDVINDEVKDPNEVYEDLSNPVEPEQSDSDEAADITIPTLININPQSVLEMCRKASAAADKEKGNKPIIHSEKIDNVQYIVIGIKNDDGDVPYSKFMELVDFTIDNVDYPMKVSAALADWYAMIKDQLESMLIRIIDEGIEVVVFSGWGYAGALVPVIIMSNLYKRLPMNFLTFGAPRSGDLGFVQIFSACKFQGQRFVNTEDQNANSPNPPKFGHCANPQAFTYVGKTLEENHSIDTYDLVLSNINAYPVNEEEV